MLINYLYIHWHILFFPILCRNTEASEEAGCSSGGGQSSSAFISKTHDSSANILGSQTENINDLIKSIAKDSSFMNEKEISHEMQEFSKNHEPTLSGTV